MGGLCSRKEEKENVGIVEFGLKIIAYTKFGWINKGGLLGERGRERTPSIFASPFRAEAG